MNDAQIWTVIGGFLAVTVAMSGLLLRIVKVEIANGVMELNGKIEVLSSKMDHLDRDVQSVVSRLMGDGPTG